MLHHNNTDDLYENWGGYSMLPFFQLMIFQVVNNAPIDGENLYHP